MFRFKGFSPRANAAINLALSQACLLGHTYIGSEHLMLGLLKEGSGVAYNVLNKLGVTAESYEKLIRERIGAGSPTSLGGGGGGVVFLGGGGGRAQSQKTWGMDRMERKFSAGAPCVIKPSLFRQQ